MFDLRYWALVILLASPFSCSLANQSYEKMAEFFLASLNDPSVNHFNNGFSSKELTLLDSLSDKQSFLSNATTLPELMPICGLANKVNFFILYYDMESVADKNTDLNQIPTIMLNLVSKNTIRFQNQLSLIQSFYITCQAKTLPLLADFYETLPPADLTEVRKQGLLEAQQGLVGIYSNSAVSLLDENLNPNYKDTIAAVLMEHSAIYFASLNPAQRNSVLELIQPYRQKLKKQYPEFLQNLEFNLEQAPCNALCSAG